MTQVQFVEAIGMSLRTYHKRLTDSDWNLEELIEISKFNEGEVKVQSGGGTYSVKIVEIE